MFLEEIITRENGVITKEEIQQIETLINNAQKALEEISALTGDINFGCYTDEEEGYFSMWYGGGYFNFRIQE